MDCKVIPPPSPDVQGKRDLGGPPYHCGDEEEYPLKGLTEVCREEAEKLRVQEESPGSDQEKVIDPGPPYDYGDEEETLLRKATEMLERLWVEKSCGIQCRPGSKKEEPTAWPPRPQTKDAEPSGNHGQPDPSTPSPNPKAGTFSSSSRLTPSEVMSLRADMTASAERLAGKFKRDFQECPPFPGV